MNTFFRETDLATISVYLHINRKFITKIHMDLGFMHFIDMELQSWVKHKLPLDDEKSLP